MSHFTISFHEFTKKKSEFLPFYFCFFTEEFRIGTLVNKTNVTRYVKWVYRLVYSISDLVRVFSAIFKVKKRVCIVLNKITRLILVHFSNVI